MSSIPNIPHSDVPLGKDEDSNVEVSTVGEIPTFTFKAKSHYELGENLKMLDSTGNYNLFISIPPYSDTLLNYTVTKINNSEIVNYVPGNMRDSEIIVSAFDGQGNKKIRYFRFFDLDNSFYNRRDEAYSPLNLSFNAINLASGIKSIIFETKSLTLVVIPFILIVKAPTGALLTDISTKSATSWT